MSFISFNRPRHKFGAQKTICSLGHPHPSKLEAAVCELLQLRERAKEIADLKWIAPVDLFYTVAGQEYHKRWKVDFSFTEVKTGIKTWAEAKGAETADYKQRRDLWKQGAGPGPLEIFKGTHARPQLVQTIIPKKEREI